ncbi:MAG: hypothetical protein ABIR68_08190 [Ilumatobacteraceae bacterium]
MATPGRPWATSDGQHLLAAPATPALRSRDLSGIRSRANSPIPFARNLLALRELIATVGPPVWAARPTAGALLGFDGSQLEPPFHLLVPRGRNVVRVGHVVHTGREIGPLDTTMVEGVPTTSATRTIIDLATSEPASRLTVCVDSAVRDRLTSEDFLHRRLVGLRRHGRQGIGTLLDVLAGIDVARGGHSWLEREFLRRLAAAGLTRPATQQVLAKRGQRLIRVDLHFPGTPVVVELLGSTFHRTVMQMDADAARLNRLLLDGFLPLQFTYLQVVEEPDDCVAVVREALVRS